MSKGSRTDLCGGWPERAIPTATAGVFSDAGASCASLAKDLIHHVPDSSRFCPVNGD